MQLPRTLPSCDSPARDRRWCSSRARARLATFTLAIFAVAAPALVSALRRSRSRSTLLQLPQLRSPFGQSHSRSSLLGNPRVPAFRRSRPCLPLGGHVPCPSFDDHVMLAFTVPVLAFVFRQLRSHPRSGHVVVRSCERPSTLASVFTSDRPLAKRIGRAHLLVLVDRGPPFGITIRTPSAHSPRAREFVSRFDGADCDPLSIENRRFTPLPSIALTLVSRRSSTRCRTSSRSNVHVLRRVHPKRAPSCFAWSPPFLGRDVR
jgi:hypothetical protein